MDFQLLSIAPDHEPVDWAGALGSADLASILCHCRHGESFPPLCCRGRVPE